jgi:hypothetical protein
MPRWYRSAARCPFHGLSQQTPVLGLHRFDPTTNIAQFQLGVNYWRRLGIVEEESILAKATEQRWQDITEGTLSITGKGNFQPDWVLLDSADYRDPAYRSAAALEYIAWVLSEINKKLGPAKSG